jgi:hypothetical protein
MAINKIMSLKLFKIGCCSRVFKWLLLLMVALYPSTAGAADWHTLAQPIGTENTPFLVDPAVLNASYASNKGPWELTTTVTSIKTTVPLAFVRFYNPTATVNPSGQEGSWVMRASAVRGLNAAQIRTLFALPNTPSMMTLGLSVPGASFYTGIAGAIDGWGAGGGQQSQATGGPYTTFFNGQSIMEAVLSYPAMADTDNGRTVGTYLVSHSPAAYSDMETVYNALDVLYNPASKTLFNNALSALSSERYDNLASTGFQAVSQQNQAIDDRVDRIAVNGSKSGIWVKAARSFQHFSASGFDGHISGMIFGSDKKISETMHSGISLAWMHGALEWQNDGGQAITDYYRAAAYSSLIYDRAFLQAVASFGLSDGNALRNIHISTLYQPSLHGPSLSPLAELSRTAAAAYNGWDADLYLRSGLVLHTGTFTFLPVVGFGYLNQSRNSFSETGAESLDLQVAGAQSQTLHCHADLRIERAFQLSNRQKITPYIMIDWAYARRLDAHAVSASMNGWSDSFTTTASSANISLYTGTAGLEVALSKSLIIKADYSAQYHDGERQSAFGATVNYEF